MAIKTYKPYTHSRRNMTGSAFDEITKKEPEKSLVVRVKNNAGRNSYGKITVRHQGGGHKNKYNRRFQEKQGWNRGDGCRYRV